jgi:hypothetical protein
MMEQFAKKFVFFVMMFIGAFLLASIIHSQIDGCFDALVMGWAGGGLVTFVLLMAIFFVPHQGPYTRRKTDKLKDNK